MNNRDCTVHESMLIEKVEEIINSNKESDLALCFVVALKEMSEITVRKILNKDTDWWVDSANCAIDLACENVFDN